jgi:hypothetical protein
MIARRKLVVCALSIAAWIIALAAAIILPPRLAKPDLRVIAAPVDPAKLLKLGEPEAPLTLQPGEGIDLNLVLKDGQVQVIVRPEGVEVVQ